MSTFTPTNVVDMNKERDWSASLGMMDWDNTRIVFTKRTLIEFLRYTGTTVDTNFHNIQKLPKYATFGKLSEDATAQPAAADASTSASASEAIPESESASDFGGFRPTRRVRTAPGGDTHDIFGHYVNDDALAGAPPRRQQAAAEAEPAQQEEAESTHTRKQSSSLFDESPVPKADFRPTRRVREMPGGRDSISEIL